MKSDKERLVECVTCEFFDECFDSAPVPEEYEDGSCKTKEKFKEQHDCK